MESKFINNSIHLINMRAIIIFESVDEAISLLEEYDRTITKEEMSKEQIVRESVTKNVFRAFHNLNKKPSEIYREWALKNLDKIIEKLNRISTKEEYNEQLFKWIYSFIDYWDSQITKPDNRIIFGPASKMINLLIKTLNESTYLNNEKVIPFYNVPFDEYSLKPLIKIINQLTNVNYKIDIPKIPTMSYISTPELYQIIQNAVFKLCDKAEITPILYDYWCWNEKH